MRTLGDRCSFARSDWALTDLDLSLRETPSAKMTGRQEANIDRRQRNSFMVALHLFDPDHKSGFPQGTCAGSPAVEGYGQDDGKPQQRGKTIRAAIADQTLPELAAVLETTQFN